MYDNKKYNSTNGLPSCDLFNNTASNEYITDIPLTSTTEQDFFTIRISPLYDFQNLKYYKNIKILSEKSKFAYEKQLSIEKSEDFINYIQLNELTLKFGMLLEEFLKQYFNNSLIKPLKCILTMFIFPGENYKEPMIKIIFPDTDDFNNLKIRDDIEEKFKIFLVNKSENVEEFKAFRNIQKKFRFVIQRE
ncbi:MAG: hypothetical protein ACTSRP_25385 [Candidatus Helarchaeota archaeon]